MTYRLPAWAVLVAAFLVQVVLARLGLHMVDMLWAGLVYVCLTRGAAASIGAGAAAGLLEDAVSGGLYGIGGFAKTLTAYAASLGGRLFVTESWAARAILLAGGVLLDALARGALHALFFEGGGASFWDAARETLLRAAGTLALGLPALHGLRRIEKWVERRKYGR